MYINNGVILPLYLLIIKDMREVLRAAGEVHLRDKGVDVQIVERFDEWFNHFLGFMVKHVKEFVATNSEVAKNEWSSLTGPAVEEARSQLQSLGNLVSDFTFDTSIFNAISDANK